MATSWRPKHKDGTPKVFAIVLVAGPNKGRVKSLHHSFDAAMRKQPACFYSLRTVPAGVKVSVGDVRPELLAR